MDSADKKTESLQDKARHELIEYGLNVLYLALVFASFMLDKYTFSVAT